MIDEDPLEVWYRELVEEYLADQYCLGVWLARRHREVFPELYD